MTQVLEAAVWKAGRGRICLISPGELSTNPRLVKEARVLAAAGFSVSIVCGRYLNPSRDAGAMSASSKWDIREVPFGRIQASRWTYARQTILQKSARLAFRLGCKFTGLAVTALAPVTIDLIRAAVSAPPADLYIAHYSAALPAAAFAARWHSAIYAFDAEDFHLGDLPNLPKYDLDKHIIRTIEQRYLPDAAYMTAASPLIADAYVEAYGIASPRVVLNVFPKSSAPRQPSPSGIALPGPSLYWFSQTIGPGRGLETAVEAIARAISRPHLYLRGTPAVGYEAHLLEIANRGGVADRVHFLKPEDPEALERLGAAYDLGFVGETAETYNRQIALTNKLFSYLCSGLPVIASDISSHRKLAPELGEAISLFPIGDAHGLAVIIDAFLTTTARLASARKAAWMLGQERFSWEHECCALITSIASVLGGDKGGSAKREIST